MHLSARSRPSKIGVIWNPESGRGRTRRAFPAIADRLQQALPETEIQIEGTSASGSAKEQAAVLATQGCEIVVAVGGDGTICDVMQGVLGSGAALAILPCGTGNDFARTLGIGISSDRAIDAIAEGCRARVDVASWQQDGAKGHFINVAGCGFDAVVAERVNQGFRRLRGTSAYLAAILHVLRTYRPVTFAITVDGEELCRKAMLCAFANAQSYGGGMKVAPTANLQDGFLDLVIIGEFGRAEFLYNFHKVLKGAHLSHPKVLHRRFKRLAIKSDPPVPCLVDGELLPGSCLEIEVIPSAIEIVVPKESLLRLSHP